MDAYWHARSALPNDRSLPPRRMMPTMVWADGLGHTQCIGRQVDFCGRLSAISRHQQRDGWPGSWPLISLHCSCCRPIAPR